MNVSEDLSRVWKDVGNVLEPDKSWLTDAAKRDCIQKKLFYFNSQHSNSPEHIDRLIKALSPGQALVQAAIEWQHPAIGQSETCSVNDKLRGHQWRLVIAYSGFEIASKALMMDKWNRQVEKEMYERFLEKCFLPDYKPIEPPRGKPKLAKWLNKEDGALASFLRVTSGDKKAIDRWLVQSQSVDSWCEAYKLAKALRNASAHGFLLPTKIHDWGLKNGFLRLTDDLAKIVIPGLSKLA
ncbi:MULTISPECIES: hypothetical protein [unclassified Microcoleus]|uniref:hypothetical protein n=1 Tax=unclassified Microcoleus TaxID=2642155 RepID=UPI002FD05534